MGTECSEKNGVPVQQRRLGGSESSRRTVANESWARSVGGVEASVGVGADRTEGEKGNILGAIQEMRSNGYAQLASYGEDIMAGRVEDVHVKWKDVEVWKKQA